MKAIGARRCNTILINAGVDPWQNSQRAERTLAAATRPSLRPFHNRSFRELGPSGKIGSLIAGYEMRSGSLQASAR